MDHRHDERVGQDQQVERRVAQKRDGAARPRSGGRRERRRGAPPPTSFPPPAPRRLPAREGSRPPRGTGRPGRSAPAGEGWPERTAGGSSPHPRIPCRAEPHLHLAPCVAECPHRARRRRDACTAPSAPASGPDGARPFRSPCRHPRPPAPPGRPAGWHELPGTRHSSGPPRSRPPGRPAGGSSTVSRIRGRSSSCASLRIRSPARADVFQWTCLGSSPGAVGAQIVEADPSAAPIPLSPAGLQGRRDLLRGERAHGGIDENGIVVQWAADLGEQTEGKARGQAQPRKAVPAPPCERQVVPPVLAPPRRDRQEEARAPPSDRSGPARPDGGRRREGAVCR